MDDDVERTIAQGLVVGDRQALADAFRLYASLVHAFSVRRVGHDAADDLTQQVFVAAWRSRASFDPDRGVVPAWLVGIARNLANRSFRSARETPTADTRLHGGATTVAAGAPDTDNDVDAIATRLLVGAALARLGPAQRQALELGYLEGLTQAEVAARMDLPLGTVKSHQRRGLHRLRTTLGGGT